MLCLPVRRGIEGFAFPVWRQNTALGVDQPVREPSAVKLWNSERDCVRHVLVQDSHENDWHRGEEEVEQDDVGVVENVGDVEVAEHLKPEDTERPDHILVEEVADGLSQPPVRPSAVNQHKSLQEPKLTNGVVRGHSCLSTFFTGNTNANIGFLDHGHIVGTYRPYVRTQSGPF